MPLFTPPVRRRPESLAIIFDLVRPAGTYDLATATGDVWVEIIGAQVKTAAGGLTSASVVTSHTAPKTVIAAVLLAALILDAQPVVALNSFLLQSGRKIQGTIVGTGTLGELDVVVRWTPVSADAVLG